jgi:hypothetical protein
VAHVSVQIQWPDGLDSLPAGARARVTVEDVSRADESSTVLGEKVLGDLDPSGTTVADVEVADADPQAVLVARVHVRTGVTGARGIELGDFVSTQSHPVLTRGHGDAVVVPLRKVGS